MVAPDRAIDVGPREVFADERDSRVHRADLWLDLQGSPSVVDPEELVQSDADLAPEGYSADHETDQLPVLVEQRAAARARVHDDD